MPIACYYFERRKFCGENPQIISRGVIGNTAGFGPVVLGSSPGGRAFLYACGVRTTLTLKKDHLELGWSFFRFLNMYPSAVGTARRC